MWTGKGDGCGAPWAGKPSSISIPDHAPTGVVHHVCEGWMRWSTGASDLVAACTRKGAGEEAHVCDRRVWSD